MSVLLGVRGTIRFGIQAVQQHTEFAAYAALWARAEELGFDWASVCDHFLPTQSTSDGPCFEGPTLLAAMAARTRRLRCGILVAGNTYRHPAVLANVAATIDHISGGRLEFGVGTGWFKREHEQYGISFPSPGERSQRLRETAAILRSLWTEVETTYQGHYYRLTNARCEPKPIQRLHLPLWIGGSGERVLLRVVAESADGWNTFLPPEDAYRRKLEALAGHCADLSRDPDEIRKAVIFHAVLGESDSAAEERLRERASVIGADPEALRARGTQALTPERCAEMLGRYARLGVADFVLYVRPPADYETIELLSRQVAPAVRAGIS